MFYNYYRDVAVVSWLRESDPSAFMTLKMITTMDAIFLNRNGEIYIKLQSFLIKCHLLVPELTGRSCTLQS